MIYDLRILVHSNGSKTLQMCVERGSGGRDEDGVLHITQSRPVWIDVPEHKHWKYDATGEIQILDEFLNVPAM